ncbi:hypothetical protein F4806DRAFT_285262 [Annulohypoxylon nitens]|nr:hypothetical protein F4806DRAFT_285262 [Annulohypoxylon nitens]
MNSITILVPLCLALDAVTSVPFFGIFMILFLQMIRNGVLADNHEAGSNITSLAVNAAFWVYINMNIKSTVAKEIYAVALIETCRRFYGRELPALHIVAAIKLLHAYLDESQNFLITVLSFLAAMTISDSTFVAIGQAASQAAGQAFL